MHKIIIGYTLAVLVGAYLSLKPDVGPPPGILPEKALAYAHEHDLTDGNVYNDYNYGGFLVSRHIPTFVDGRGVLFDLKDYFFPSDQRFEAALERYHVTWALVGVNHHSRHWLDVHWTKLYEDEVAVVYAKP